MGRPHQLGILGVALLCLLVLGGCSQGEAPDYDAEFQSDFLRQCTDTYVGSAGRQVCECWYTAVSGSIDFDRLPPLDELMGDDLDQGASREPGGRTDRPLAELANCVRGLNAEATIPATTAPPPTEPPPPTTTSPTTTTVPA